jgi:hypothetical protein
MLAEQHEDLSMDKFELNGPPTIRAEGGLVLLTLPIIIRTRADQTGKIEVELSLEQAEELQGQIDSAVKLAKIRQRD